MIETLEKIDKIMSLELWGIFIGAFICLLSFMIVLFIDDYISNINWKSFFDRNYHLLFNKKKCFKLYFKYNVFKYNDIVLTAENQKARCLSKDWYKLIKKVV